MSFPTDLDSDSRPYHSVAAAIELALPHCETDIGFTSLRPTEAFVNRLRLPFPIWSVLRTLLQHFLAAREFHQLKSKRFIFVREFLTLPTLLALPSFLPYRRQLILFLHHNVQRAHTFWLHRVALFLLVRLGFRFCCLESSEGFEKLALGHGSHQLILLPHCIPEQAENSFPIKYVGRPRIGVVGGIRAEKGVRGLLRRLIELKKSGRLDAEILLGCSDKSFLQRYEGRVDHAVDTHCYQKYRETLAGCDVVVLNYQRQSYFYRGSGVITEAAEVGTAVVCPDYPVFRTQLTNPVTIGLPMASLADLEVTLAAAVRIARSNPAVFEDYRAYRSPKRIAGAIDAFVNAADKPALPAR